MFRRENLVGLLLLLFCGVVAAIMIRAIITGELPQLDLPPAVGWALGIGFVGLLLFGVGRSFLDRRSSGGGPSWPDPRTGQRSLWDRLRGRDH